MFYPFNQNNSGGRFIGPALVVYIEAESEESANDIAQEHDIYFNGCEYGRDCSCCGDRWSTTWYEAVEDPKQDLIREEKEFYLAFKRLWATQDQVPLCLIVYKNGSTEILEADWNENDV